MQLKQAIRQTPVETGARAVKGAAVQHPQTVLTTEAVQQPVQQQRRGGKKLTLPPAMDVAIALGVLYGLILYCVLVTIQNACDGNSDAWNSLLDWKFLPLVKLLTTTLFTLLPLLLAFWLGYKQRDGVKGAALCFALGSALVLCFAVCMVQPSLIRYAAWSNLVPWPLHEISPDAIGRVVAAQMLASGALGGVCGKAAQARAARSRKNNR